MPDSLYIVTQDVTFEPVNSIVGYFLAVFLIVICLLAILLCIFFIKEIFR